MGGACCASEETQPQVYDVEDKQKLISPHTSDFVDNQEDPAKEAVPSAVAPSISASVSDGGNNESEDKRLSAAGDAVTDSSEITPFKKELASVLVLQDSSESEEEPVGGEDTPEKDAELRALDSFSKSMGLDIMECAIDEDEMDEDQSGMMDDMGQLIWGSKTGARDAIHIDTSEDHLFPPLLKGSLQINVKEVHVFVETVEVDLDDQSPTPSQSSRSSLAIIDDTSSTEVKPAMFSLVLDESKAKEHAAVAAKKHKKSGGSKSLIKGGFIGKKLGGGSSAIKHEGVWIECNFKQGSKQALIKSEDTFDSRPSDYSTIDLREKFEFALDIDEITDERFVITNAHEMNHHLSQASEIMHGMVSMVSSISDTTTLSGSGSGSGSGIIGGKMDDDDHSGGSLSSSKKKKTRKGKVDGLIDLCINKSQGVLGSVKHVGQACLHIDALIERGLINRRGEWEDLILPLYEDNDEEFEQHWQKKQKKSSKKKKSTSSSTTTTTMMKIKRPETGFIVLSCRLHWSDSVLHEWNESLKKSELMELTMVVAEESGDVIKDKYYMLSHHMIRMKLVLLGMLFDPDCLNEYDISDARKLIMDLKEQGTQSAMYDDMRTNVCVTMEYLSMDVVNEDENMELVKQELLKMKQIKQTEEEAAQSCSDVIIHQRQLTKLHCSKSKDVLFIGEKFVFELNPFIPESESAVSDAVGFHPQWMFDHRYKMTLKAPGSIQLNVKTVSDDGTKKNKLGTGLLILKDVINQTSVEVGQKISDDLLFPIPMYEPVSKSELSRDTKQQLMGYLLCRTKFGFQD